jgi:transcriptional regulator with XRE-family HTH domain
MNPRSFHPCTVVGFRWPSRRAAAWIPPNLVMTCSAWEGRSRMVILYGKNVRTSNMESVTEWCEVAGMETNDSPALRLKRLRERSKLSMKAIAKALGFKGASSYQRYENPDQFTKQHLPLQMAKTLAELFAGKGTPPISKEEVLVLAGLEDLSTSQLRSLDEQSWVWCIGEAASGVWKEAFEWPRGNWIPVAVSVRDERFPGVARSAVRVAGDSMDQLYPDGSFVIFVRFSDIDRGPRPGDRIVALRRRHELVEASVKEFSVDPRGRSWLIPRSNHPSHGAISLGGPRDNSEVIELFGLVVGSQRIE